MVGNSIDPTAELHNVTFLGGKNTIGRHSVLRNVTIGAGNSIGDHCELGDDDGDITIGADNHISDHVRIFSGILAPTWIGNENVLMSHVLLGEGCFIENKNGLGVRSALLAHVHLMGSVHLLSQCLIEPSIVIGRGVIASRGSHATEHVPPAHGLNGNLIYPPGVDPSADASCEMLRFIRAVDVAEGYLKND